ncbi:hypothetical protein CEXT_751271 [Caerostris extrusa]|uniref:Uncharacterized protein n=1 Tax=Caerostris extrusa TaxID=172846 RepID=A0AAV4W364_CAEEX|nr:hypothetical protein CEXT_751271 [Caerostris extrusa]
MCLKIPAADFDAAIWFYCKIIKSPPQGWDRSSMTHVLLHLLTIRSNMGAMNASKILEFFEFIFDAINKESILKPIFVSVFVEICAQVFCDSVGVLDVTQMPSTHDSSQPSKKRRVEVCFKTFIDSLTSSKIVPWSGSNDHSADDTSNEYILSSILCPFCDSSNIWKVSYQIIIFAAKVICFRD